MHEETRAGDFKLLYISWYIPEFKTSLGTELCTYQNIEQESWKEEVNRANWRVLPSSRVYRVTCITSHMQSTAQGPIFPVEKHNHSRPGRCQETCLNHPRKLICSRSNPIEMELLRIQEKHWLGKRIKIINTRSWSAVELLSGTYLECSGGEYRMMMIIIIYQLLQNYCIIAVKRKDSLLSKSKVCFPFLIPFFFMQERPRHSPCSSVQYLT